MLLLLTMRIIVDKIFWKLTSIFQIKVGEAIT